MTEWEELSAEELGRRIRAARAYAGLGQAELSENLQMSQTTLARIEAGEPKARKIEMWAVAEMCGLPRAWFTGEMPDPFPPIRTKKPPRAAQEGE